MRIPILRLGNILLTSIQSDITDTQALTLQYDILKRLEQSRALGVLLDISALDVIDSYMTRILSETARMARLMGGEVVITGMNPMVALALIEMGRDLSDVLTALDVEQGVDKLRQRFAAIESEAGKEEGAFDGGD
jgi:rsbT antagonist protein RsbS